MNEITEYFLLMMADPDDLFAVEIHEKSNPSKSFLTIAFATGAKEFYLWIGPPDECTISDHLLSAIFIEVKAELHAWISKVSEEDLDEAPFAGVCEQLRVQKVTDGAVLIMTELGVEVCTLHSDARGALTWVLHENFESILVKEVEFDRVVAEAKVLLSATRD